MMRGMAIGRTGVFTFALDHQPIREAQATVAELEELGYGAVWIPELTGREALTHASVLLAATQRMAIANGIARIGDRAPRTAAAAQRMLSAAYPSRHLLGLGIGRPKPDGPKPIEAMRAYLDAMDSTDMVSPESDCRPVRVLAAYGPAMMMLAAERAAGAHTYLVPVEHTSWARERLGTDSLLAVEQAAVFEQDAAEARRVARTHLEYYLRTPQNLAKFRRFGYSDEDFRGGGSDRLVDALVAWGDVDRIAARVRDHLVAGADHVCVQVLDTKLGAAPMSQWRLLAEVLPG